MGNHTKNQDDYTKDTEQSNPFSDNPIKANAQKSMLDKTKSQHQDEGLSQ